MYQICDINKNLFEKEYFILNHFYSNLIFPSIYLSIYCRAKMTGINQCEDYMMFQRALKQLR